MDKEARICVAGTDTLMGGAIVRELKGQGYSCIAPSADEEPAWSDEHAVAEYMQRTQPEYVFVAAGKSAGILGNQQYPAALMLDNLRVAANVIDSAYHCGVQKLLYLASSCCYPKHCAQPMRVESLLSGPLEPTSEPYALAKLAGIKLCQAYRRQYGANFVVGILGDAFGPGDDFSAENSHVIPALIRRMHEAKAAGADSVVIWGSGSPRREFMLSDELAGACIHVMQHYEGPRPINLAGAPALSIREAAESIREVVGFEGELVFDTTKPDGMPMKGLDSTPLRELGWSPCTSFRKAVQQTYRWFLGNAAKEGTTVGG